MNLMQSPSAAGERVPASPWPMVTAGLTGVALAALLLHTAPLMAAPESTFFQIVSGLRLLLLGAGGLMLAIAVVKHPRSPAVLGVGAGAAALASFAVDPTWDSLRMALRVLTVVAAAAAILVRLPRAVQRFAISALIVFHFGGILTAVTSVPPPNGAAAPWLTSQLWTRVYRPYLQFMYLSNAYHFYSPDPGPATLLWARVEYADKSFRWITLPSRDEHMKDPFALAYYRRLCLTESTNQLMSVNAVTPPMVQQRTEAGAKIGMPTPVDIERWMPTVPQHRLPTDYSASMLSSYARFLAGHYPHDDPAVEVRGVKIYRVVHAMPSPDNVAKGTDPADHTLYLPYYQGEFDRDGRLVDPNDPLLYWFIPIVRVPKAGPTGAPESEIVNFVEIHASRMPRRTEQ